MKTVSLPAELDYRIRYSMFHFLDDQPESLSIQVQPQFTGCRVHFDDDAVVYNLYNLIESCRQEGNWYLLTCECNYADDIGIYSKIQVSHDSSSIIWNIHTPDYISIIDEEWNTRAQYLQLIFNKNQYCQTVCKLIEDLQEKIRSPVSLETLKATDFTKSYNDIAIHQDLLTAFPNISLPVQPVYPHEEVDIEEILAIDPKQIAKMNPIQLN